METVWVYHHCWQTSFDSSYNGNILVNAMTLGLVKKNKIFYSKAAGLNKPVIYVGSKTGRDGIHGASMASASFDEKIEEKNQQYKLEIHLLKNFY